jgi:phospholipase C
VLRRVTALHFASFAVACGACDTASDVRAAPAFDAACASPVRPDPHAVERTSCTFAAGARVADTLAFTAAERQKLPITHVVVVVQENRSFDHYFGRLSSGPQIEAEGWPAGYTNPDAQDAAVAPQHLASACLPSDLPHQSAAMLAGWDNGAMDGFVKSASSSTSDGHFAIGYYDGTDLPFYYWLASTYAIADRYFGSALGGTWANRDFLYAATSDGVLDTATRVITVPTIFDALDTAHVAWGVYTDGPARQDALGWTNAHVGVAPFSAFLSELAAGTLPPVAFVDPTDAQDEHPPHAISGGEQWTRSIYEAAIASPLWSRLAIVFTYDESGGLFDHVPPPSACAPSASWPTFDRYGVRIPAIVISPYARRHVVSHVVHDHTSTLRLIEAIHDLPALTARDANADALFDMFDFDCAPMLAPPAAPAAGDGTCP